METIPRYVEALKRLSQEEQEELRALIGKSDLGLLPIDPLPSQKISTSFARTDTGNAERFVSQHAANIRYCAIYKAWFIWDGQRWKEDTAGRIYHLARKTVRSIPKDADLFPDGDPMRVEILKHALKSENRERVKAMLELAQYDPDITIEPKHFDSNQWVLNCLNGTLNLKTGCLQPHRQEDLITKICPVEYDPGAICSRWEQFLSEIFCSNELIAYVQKVSGYILTGSKKEQDFYLFYGTGANGKSTFIKNLMDLLGPDYAKQTAANALLAKQHETAGEEIAVLEGARLVSTIEIDDGKRLAESLVKQLTGGDRVRVRRLYSNSFEFEPTFKLVMVCNHKPRITGTDSGIWRRIRLIPFNVQIPEHQQDPDLADKLKQELPGILNWCIEGCLKWQKEGLRPPEEVNAATADYRVESDAIGAFLDECLITDNSNDRIQAAVLYEAYKEWTDRGGEYALSMRRFNERLRQKGFQCIATTGNRSYWQGISLVDESRSDWEGLGREIDSG